MAGMQLRLVEKVPDSRKRQPQTGVLGTKECILITQTLPYTFQSYLATLSIIKCYIQREANYSCILIIIYNIITSTFWLLVRMLKFIKELTSMEK